MKITRSYILALIAAIVVIVWFAINSLGAKADETNTLTRSEAAALEASVLPIVIVEYHTATLHKNRFELYGRTEANREVSIKAKTAGLVARTPISEGRIVGRNTVVCQQEVDAREAVLDQAKARLKSSEFDLQSTQTLVDKGYRSPLQLENLKAQVDSARAGVKQAQIELNNVRMRAPFRGIFDQQMAEVGDFLSPGQACGLLIEMDPLVVTVELTENQIGVVDIGQTADITLATGETVMGEIRFVESRANPSTRTFRTEISVPNPDFALKAGVTATVTVQAGDVMAQQVPSKILSLSDQGSVGIRYLDYDDRVRFAAVTTIDEDANGIWVTGLPEETRIITQGQDYVSVGTQVEPRFAGDTASNSETPTP